MAAGRGLCLGIVAAGLLLGVQVARADCNKPAADAVTQVVVPGHPFSAIPTPDGCTLFVSLLDKQSRIAVVARDNGALSLARVVPAEGAVAGMALSPDGRFLAAAADRKVLVFDAGKLAAGADDAMVASSAGDAHAGAIYAGFSRDGSLLFVANESGASLSVYSAAGLPGALKLLGQIPTGSAPVGLAFSPDGKILYSTSQAGPPGWERKCTTEGPAHPEGILLVIDVARAAADPQHAVLGGVAAGCNPVRVALSPDGATAYVTSRGANAIQVFDTTRLLNDPTHASRGTVAVGPSPVGVAATSGKVFVTNSNRFGGGANQSVSVLDAAKPDAPQSGIPAGGFPRELMVTADGKTLLITNYTSGSVELVDMARLAEVAK